MASRKNIKKAMEMATQDARKRSAKKLFDKMGDIDEKLGSKKTKKNKYGIKTPKFKVPE